MLRVSDNRRFLVRDDGTPFFYLGDTAWALFQRLDLAEAARYLEDRAIRSSAAGTTRALAQLTRSAPSRPAARTHSPRPRAAPTTTGCWRSILKDVSNRC